MNVLLENKSFRLLLFAFVLFMIGHVIYKFSLSIFLYGNGTNIRMAYSIAMSTTALFALCSIIWGALLRILRFQSHKYLMALGAILNALGLLFIYFYTYVGFNIGLALNIVGSSLFTVNIRFLTTEHFQTPVLIQKSNQIRHVAMNLGAIVGFVFFSLMPLSKSNFIYIFSAFIMLLTGVFVVLNYQSIIDVSKTSCRRPWLIYFICLVLVCTCVVLLSYELPLRITVMAAFSFVLVFIVVLALKNRNWNYFLFLVVLIFAASTYWLGYSVFFSQVGVFLTHLKGIYIFKFELSQLSLLMFDPLTNMIFGALVVHFTIKQLRPNSYQLLYIGLLLFTASFLLLSYSNYLIKSGHGEPLLIIISAIVFFGMAEFLLMSTTLAKTRVLVDSREDFPFFVGVIQGSIAFSTAIAYYFIGHSIPKEKHSVVCAEQNIKLYLIIAGIGFFCACIFIIMQAFRRQYRIN